MEAAPLPIKRTAKRSSRGSGDAPPDVAAEHLALLSHELRTPLNAILNWVQVLQKSPTDQDVVTRSAQAIERNARLQADLVNDLIDISRINFGQIKLRTSSVDLDHLLRSALLAVEHAVRAKRIRITAVSSGSVFVHGDERRLRQVMANLIDNAIKFTPVEGAITVALCLRTKSAVLTVADGGCGFEPSLSARLFDRFHKADDTAQREGLGLGLYIVKNIVEQHGGNITAHSSGPGEGATFTVRLPAVVDSRPPHEQS